MCIYASKFINATKVTTIRGTTKLINKLANFQIISRLFNF